MMEVWVDKQAPPIVTEMVVDGFAHCSNSRCPGNGQTPVKVVRQLVEVLFISDLPLGVETSHVNIRLATAADVEHALAMGWRDMSTVDFGELQCPYCGKGREVTAQERPEYDPTEWDPMFLLDRGAKFNRAAQGGAAGEQIAALQEQLAEERAARQETDRKLDILLDAIKAPDDPGEAEA